MSSFVLTLHGHLPWVLHHGRWPHGEHWLFEAAVETYLPLLGVVDKLERRGIAANITLGLTPVLLEQLSHPRFVRGFRAYLDDRLAVAAADQGQQPFALLAARWEEWLSEQRDRFEAHQGNIVEAFASHARAGRIELLSSYAAHGYGPLLLHDQSVRAQLRAGLQTSERHLGFRPTGVWLPECAFRPEGEWTPPLLHGDVRQRAGIDRILEQEGVTHFFVDAHLVRAARSEGTQRADHFDKVGWDEAEQYEGRGWRDVLDVHWVNTTGGASKVAAFARHPEASEQVWSGEVGYPGDARYLEFHKKHGDQGLRYWRVTGGGVDLGDKQLYRSEDVESAIYEHVQHFAATIRAVLGQYRDGTGREGVLTAPFDAELFGHWWHEGPRFLHDLILALDSAPEVAMRTAQDVLQSEPPELVVWLPEGSWGDGGDHRVWFSDESRWMWEALYRAEDRLLTLLWDARDADETIKAVLRKASRALLLAQASDWPFVITTQGAVDYGYRRLCGHLAEFDDLARQVSDLLAGREPSEIEEGAERMFDLLEDCFGDVGLEVWE